MMMITVQEKGDGDYYILGHTNTVGPFFIPEISAGELCKLEKEGVTVIIRKGK